MERGGTVQGGTFLERKNALPVKLIQYLQTPRATVRKAVYKLRLSRAHVEMLRVAINKLFK